MIRSRANWIRFLVLSAFVAAVFAATSAVSSGQEGALPALPTGFDADPTGNEATSLGTIEACRAVGVGDTFEVDVWIRDIPEPVGFTNGVIGFAFNVLFDPAVVHMTGFDRDQLLAASGPISPFEVIDANFTGSGSTPDPLPATTGNFRIDLVDLNNQGVESGSGVLARLTFQAVGAGQTTLQLVDQLDNADVPLIQAAEAAIYPISTVQEVILSVGEPCQVQPTPRPPSNPHSNAQPTPPGTGDGQATPPPGDGETPTTGPDGQTPEGATPTAAGTTSAEDTALAVDVIPTDNTRSDIDEIDSCAAADVDDVFSVDIVIEDVDDLLAWEVPVSYDSEVLRVVDRDVQLFLAGTDSQVLDTSAQTPDPSGRYVAGAIDTADPLSPDSGTGVLVRLSFEARAEGTTEIDLDGFDINGDETIDRGVFLRDVEDRVIGDEDGDTFFDGPKERAEIRVGEDCDDSSARVVVGTLEDGNDEVVEDDDDSGILPFALGGLGLAAIAGAAGLGYLYMRRRGARGEANPGDSPPV
jgi:hypothetical protein